MLDTTEVFKKTKRGTEYLVMVCAKHNVQHCHRCFMDFSEMNDMYRTKAEEKDELLCGFVECTKLSKQMCSSCKMIKYCSRECQKADWPQHKAKCKQLSQVPLRLNIGDGSGPDEFVDVLPVGTHVSLITGSLKGDTCGKIIKFNPGKGPFVNPEIKFDPKLVKGTKWDPDDLMCTYSVKIKESGDIWKIDCGELHSNWQVGKIETTQSKSSSDDPTIEKASNFIKFNLPTMSSQKFLIMTNLGIFSSDNCFYTKRIIQELDGSMAYDIVDFNEKEDLITRLSSGVYSTCILVGVGSNGPSVMKKLLFPDLQHVVTSWVHSGGKLLIHGEGCLAKLLQDWFQLSWQFTSYCRNHQMKSNAACLSSTTLNQLPTSYSAKACHLSGVDLKCQLYSDDDGEETSIAIKSIGSNGGCIVVFGDVNAEIGTIKVIKIVSHSVIVPHNS